jgi:protein-disulfide isomerase
VGGSPVLGPRNAPVTIVEFADFQCPYCARAEDPLRAVRARYGNDVRLVWKNEPLGFHPRAAPAAELAMEARAQKGEAGFWAVHDLLLQQRGHLADDDLADVAKAAGLDVAGAMGAVKAGRHAASIEDDLDLAEDVQATGTPTFYVNGRRLVGALPFDRFAVLIDQQIAAARAALGRGVKPESLYETLQQGAVTVALDAVSVPPPTASSPSRGPEGAPVVIQIWSDLECPYCKAVEPTLAELDAAFPGKIRLVWHNHPLPFHAHARLAAEATLEAFAQKGNDGFWRMHDMLLANQGGSGQERAAVEQYAAVIGLDMDRFRSALDRAAHRAEIDADTRIAAVAGLDATPGFVINGYRLMGAQPVDKFRKIVKRVLGEAK